MITIPHEKLSCIKVVNFRVPIRDYSNSKTDIQNFRGGNLKNHLTKWKNVSSDKIILDIIENGLKIHLIDTPKPHSKFAFPLSHEEKLIVKKSSITQRKEYICISKCYWIHLYLEYLPAPKTMGPSG